MKNIGRVLTAMVTPFTSQNEVDYPQARRLATALVASGSDGLVVTGTTGESPTLSASERVKLWEEVKDAVGERASVIAGSGTNSTSESIELSKQAESVGMDALLLVVPYYNKPTQEGLYRHFVTIAESTSLPCIPYNVPSRTITNLEAPTTIRLSQVQNIIGIKEASGDLDQIAQVISNTSKDFRVWSGNDSDTFGVVSMGGYGIISVASHLIGSQIKSMVQSILCGEMTTAAHEHQRLLPFFKGIFVTANPIPIKHCINQAGFQVGTPRLPLLEADQETRKFLNTLLRTQTIDLPLDPT